MSADNLYGLLVKGKKAIPLQSVTVTGHINRYVLGLETTFSYKNTSDQPLEVLFRFPIDEGTAVVGLDAYIGTRIIHGVVQEKEEARATYDDAIASGLPAALGEEKSGDIFSLSLGNLPPKEDAKIVLKLSGELPLEGESIRFSLPTVLKPRYTPSGSSNPLAPVPTGESGTAPAVSRFNLQIANSDTITAVTSPTHDIVTNVTDDRQVNVSLKQLGPLVKDLVILINSKEPHVPKAIVEEGRPGSNQLIKSPVVMLDFFPSFESVKAACEFVFVVDRSGSMSGGYMNSAKDTLKLFLKSIPPGCYFNIIGFGSSYEHLFPKSVPYNQSNLDKAMSHATGMGANLGGTELWNPLRFVFSQKLLPGLPRQVFVLTDGSVSNTAACINETKKNATVARVFTFGIGSGASTALVKGLANAGNGSAEFIMEGDRMQSKVISSLKKALQPSVTDVALSFSVPRGITVSQSPAKVPPIFNGEKLVMYGLLNGDVKAMSTGTATLTGNIVGTPIKYELKFTIAAGNPPSVPVVHQLAAKSLIKDWENDVKKKMQVIKLSTESGVVSALTSYVAVDEEHDTPIQGAIKVYDLTASSDIEEDMLLGASLASFGGGGGKKKNKKGKSSLFTSGGPPPVPAGSSYNSLLSFDCLSAPPPPPGAPMMMMAAPPPPPPMMGGGPPPAPRNMMMPQMNYRAAPLKNRRSSPSDNLMDQLMDQPMEENWSSDEEGEEELAELCSTTSNSKAISSSSSILTPVRASTTGSGLSQLIALQSAEGYWSLNESLASVIGRSLSSLKAPPDCSNANVWATILAVVLMESVYSSQQDEWELVGMKADMWLQNQISSSVITTLKQKAKDALK